MLRIAGIAPFSTVDWPGKLACVAFLAGCPWGCPYCQNAALRSADAATCDEDALFELLGQRRGLLDGVVFSGGEPLAQAEVLGAMRQVRERGFAVGLHTCGAHPQRLEEALPLLSWVGLDVKAPWEAYDGLVRAAGAGTAAEKSLALALASGVDLEVRTTWHPDLLSSEDIATMARYLAARGVRTWAIQAYRHVGTTGELANRTVYPNDVPAGVAELFDSFEFRRA